MNDTRREQLLNQYEDAALELLMDEYAEADGKRLWNEFEEAQKKGNISPIPEDLDNQCKQIILEYTSKARRKAAFDRIVRTLSKVAIFLLVFSSISITLVMSVDAFRIPVLNYLLRHDIRFTSLLIGNQSESDINNNYEVDIEDLIPSGFYLDSKVVSPNGVLSYGYKNGDEGIISLQIIPSDGMLNFDTEEAIIQELQINDHDAVFIEKDGYRIVWLDPERNIAYDLYSNSISDKDFWKIVYSLAK